MKRKQNRKTKQRRNSCNIEHTQDLSFKPNAVFIYNVACKINCKRNKYYQGKIKSSVAVESKNHEHSYGHRKGKYSKNRIRFCLYILNKPENNYKSIKKKSKHQYHKEELNAWNYLCFLCLSKLIKNAYRRIYIWKDDVPKLKFIVRRFFYYNIR